VEVCQLFNRQWIGIDITYQSISLILKRLEDSFGKGVLNQLQINGIPKDINSAVALANRNDDRTRKEFEKWAILTYSDNRATINQKKGADKGIDGFAFFLEEGQGHRKIVLQVKSGNVSSRDIRDLYGTMTRENAAMAIFITLKTPTSEMLKEANACGFYQHKVMGRNYPCIQIVTIKEILEDGKRLDIPLSLEVLRSAEKQVNSEQLTIFTNNTDNAEVG
jgi:site-specific DNA-methyltransferase (adenine-specific)